MTDQTEREKFKVQPKFKYVDLSEDVDAWGRPKFKHSHVEAAWSAWQARAALDGGAVSQADREKVARAMIACSLATGHGDTIDELLSEMVTQIAELRQHNEEREKRFGHYVADCMSAILGEPAAKGEHTCTDLNMDAMHNAWNHFYDLRNKLEQEDNAALRTPPQEARDLALINFMVNQMRQWIWKDVATDTSEMLAELEKRSDEDFLAAFLASRQEKKDE